MLPPCENSQTEYRYEKRIEIKPILKRGDGRLGSRCRRRERSVSFPNEKGGNQENVENNNMNDYDIERHRPYKTLPYKQEHGGGGGL